MEETFNKIREEIFLGESNEAKPLHIIWGGKERLRLENSYYRIFKRIFDLSLAIPLTLFLFWMLPFISIMIKIESKGPVFFIQRRTGRGRKTFFCIKFRTMYVNEEADRLSVKEGDQRITRTGSFMRKTFIDELPQLLNVIKGEMSIVGPRPLMLSDNDLYSQLVENYHKRHKVKPGITGLAQMRGYHGMVHNVTDLKKRILADFEYIENWNLYSDLKVLWGTLLLILRK